jgi:hypothetical protein
VDGSVDSAGSEELVDAGEANTEVAGGLEGETDTAVERFAGLAAALEGAGGQGVAVDDGAGDAVAAFQVELLSAEGGGGTAEEKLRTL